MLRRMRSRATIKFNDYANPVAASELPFQKPVIGNSGSACKPDTGVNLWGAASFGKPVPLYENGTLKKDSIPNVIDQDTSTRRSGYRRAALVGGEVTNRGEEACDSRQLSRWQGHAKAAR
jgi:hypothetical protein